MLSFESASAPLWSAWQSNAKIATRLRNIIPISLDSVWPLTTDAEHVDGSLVQLDEHAVVDLPQTEQLQNLLHLGGHLQDKMCKLGQYQ